MFIITVAAQFQFGKYSSKQQLEIVEAVINRETYIAGFSSPIFSVCHFRERVWYTFQNSKCYNPSVVSKVFEIQLGKIELVMTRKLKQVFHKCSIYFTMMQLNHLDLMRYLVVLML